MVPAFKCKTAVGAAVPIPRLPPDKSLILSILLVIKGKSKFDVVPMFCADATPFPPRLQVLAALALLLNVFQSVELNAPVVEVLDNPRDNACAAKLKPFAVPILISPVFVPDKLEPVIVPVAATLDGVIAPKVREIAGVVVGVATVPLTPFADVTDTEVTVPEPDPKVDQTGDAGVPVLTW